jgi:hypothetical protein
MKKLEGWLYLMLVVCILIGGIYSLYKIATAPDGAERYEIEFRASS